MFRITTSALAIATLIASTCLLTACNTTAGAGQDVAATGNVITNAADKTKAKLQ